MLSVSIASCRDQRLLSASHTQSCLVYLATLHVWALTNEEAHRFRELTLISRSVSVNLEGLVPKPKTLGQSGYLYEAEPV